MGLCAGISVGMCAGMCTQVRKHECRHVFGHFQKDNFMKLQIPPQIEGQNGEVCQKHEAPKNATPHLLGRKMVKVRNGQTTNQETHKHKVNENHKTKHNLLIVQFAVGCCDSRLYIGSISASPTACLLHTRAIDMPSAMPRWSRYRSQGG